MRRIGLLGGTFDPVHNGHLELARAARQEAGLEKVLLIPAAGPPHKDYSGVTTFRHRLAMLRLAVADEGGLEVSDIEGDLPRPSYTVDTVRLLRRRFGVQTRLYFIIGVDAFVDMLSWKSYRELLGLVFLLVAGRKGFADSEGVERVMEALGYVQAGSIWRSADATLNDIQFLHAEIYELSSSHLRQQLGRQQPYPNGLPVEVRRYITENRLYGSHGRGEDRQSAC